MKSILVVLEKKLHDMLRVYEKNVDLFFAPSEFVKNILVERGQNEKKIRVLPHFTIESKNQRIKESQKSILYFGRLSKEKGVDILLDMMHTIGSDVTLRIVGEGPEEERLRIRNQESGIRNVTFLGRLDQKDLAEEIDRSLFIVAPSVVPETFGLTILESFARGKPVVASRIGAFPELVRDGETGFLVQPGDVRALRDRVIYLVRNERERHAMGRKALAVAKQYAPKRHYEQLFQYYQELV